MEQQDLAQDTFVVKIPTWVRWLFFFPAAVIGSLVLPAIVTLLNEATVSGSGTSLWGRVISTAVFAGSFVYIGAIVAPRKQFEIAVVQLVIFTMVMTAVLLLVAQAGTYSGSTLEFWFHIIFGIGVAVAAVFSIKKQLDG